MAGPGLLTRTKTMANATASILTSCRAHFWNLKGAPAIRESNRRVTFPELHQTVCNYTLWFIDAMKTSSLRHRGVSGDHRPISGFPPGDRKGCHGHSDGGPGGFFFKPSSVAIHTGDSVVWVWSSIGHSSASGCHIFCESSKKIMQDVRHRKLPDVAMPMHPFYGQNFVPTRYNDTSLLTRTS
jgi:hypothetical protein